MQDIFNRKILFVEDDPELLSQMKNWFQTNGNQIFSASSLHEASLILEDVNPDMIVLDIILPDGSGLNLLKGLSYVPPVIILSDLGNEDNILDGFQAGATDYIVKPCTMRILETRMRLRLLPSEQAVLSYGDLQIDSNSRTAFYCGSPLSLTSSEFNILWFLMNHPNRFYTADEIYEQVWDAPSLQTTTIRRHLSTLRQKLKEVSKENLIHTEFGKGYALLKGGLK